MAKTISPDDRAKVKLRVIEFELEGGNAAVENSIRQLTTALNTRSNGAPARVPAPKVKELPVGAPEPEDVEEHVADAEYTEVEEPTEETAPPRAAKAKTQYKPRVPNYLHEQDMTSGNTGMTFKQFAAKKKPSSNSQRHLVAAYWLKEYGNSPTINIDKVFTCYRTAEWPTNQSDWDVSFRSHVKTNRFRRINPGEYAINPIGEDDVRKMNGTE